MVPIAYEFSRFVRGVRFRLTRRLATLDPTQVWPGLDRVDIVHRPLAARFGNVKAHELAILCSAVRWLRPATLFEFGTFDGRTAWHLVRNAGPDARLWTMDLPLDHPARGNYSGSSVGEQFRDTPEAERIVQLSQDSRDFDAVPFENDIDFCFIDAGHSYQNVYLDTKNAMRMVRPGGMIFWHDYSRWWPGVQRCLDDLSRTLPVFRIENTALAALQVPLSEFHDRHALSDSV